MPATRPRPVPGAAVGAAVRTAPAFDAGVLEFAPRLRAFIRRRVRNDATADDLTQETLLKVYRSRATLRDGTRLEAWLYQIARGTIIDHYRRQRPADELPASIAGESPDEVAALRARVMVSMKNFLEELPEAYRERIFEPFYRLPGHAEQAGGVGLGLSLVRQIAQRHGGSVRCEARPGGGSVFLLTLPQA